MKKVSLAAFLLCMGMWCCPRSYAQETGSPEILPLRFSDGTLVLGLSDNGQWAVAYNENDGEDSYGKVINTSTGEYTLLPNHPKGDETSITTTYYATDVSDDGAMMVGCFQDYPAAYTEATGWRLLPSPAGWGFGLASAMTPDKRFAVGRCFISPSTQNETAVLWDLNTMAIVETPNLPTLSLSGENEDQVRFTGISADGRYIVGCTSFTTMGYTMVFIYDRENETWQPIGFDYDADGKTFTPQVEGISFIDQASFSPNSEWIGGTAYVVKRGEGETTTEYYTPYRYHVPTGEFTLYDETESHDIQAICIDNDGCLMGGTPHDSQLRSFLVRSGNYWFALDNLFRQCYAMDFYDKSGFEYTGSPISIAADGRTIAAFLAQGNNYVMRMPETMKEATARINLLADYTVSPADGTAFYSLSRVNLTFGRNVTLKGAANAAALTLDGQPVRNSLSISLGENNHSNVIIQFRGTVLEGGKEYTLTIPAGTFCVEGDEERLSPEIVLHYTGRANTPVQVEATSPAQGGSLMQLDGSTHAVIAHFDTQIALTETARAALFQDGDTEPVCELSLLAEGDRVAIYPATTQFLYKGTSYTVRVFAGSLTDASGFGANEDINLIYQGAYERTVSSTDSVAFSENFNNGLNSMMLYDGDRLTPTDEMIEWSFTDNMPWSLAADDDNASELCAVSHSMYNPAGKSDDWMCTPQCYIPDDKYVLRFRSQSYRTGKTDRLKVIVYADENQYNTLTEEVVEKMRNEGEVIYNEVELPGRHEDILVGDWVSHTLSLAEYAGKHIYVAFVNENEDQSAIFVDDLSIERATDFNIVLSLNPTMVAQESTPVTGRVNVTSEEKTFQNIQISLLDAENKVLQELKAEGLSLKNGDSYPFTFDEPMTLKVGDVNDFAIRVQMNEVIDTMRTSIRNMAFEPVKRLVVEEYTGMGCGNCPLGILALERMEEIYGDRLIPIAYHTYPGDIYAGDFTDFVGSQLGMTGAPAAVINRGSISVPMYSTITNGVEDYMFNSPDRSCWMDVAEDEMAEYADADINITATYDTLTKKLTIPYEITYALNQTGLNVTLQLLVTEDGLPGYQSNYKYNMTDPDLGEWRQGGKYGKPTVEYTFYDVARDKVDYTNYGDLVPVNVEAGQVVKGELKVDSTSQLRHLSNIHYAHAALLLLDVNTGRIINAAHAQIIDPTWDDIQGTEADAADVMVRATEGGIRVTAEDATTNVYSVGGTLLSTANVDGEATLHTGTYKGIAIVEVRTGQSHVVRKVMMK